MLRETLILAAPFFGTLLVASLLGTVLQSGCVLSVEPLKMDWNRINPVAGFKRVFSMRTLFYGARSVLKLVLLGGVLYLALRSLAPQFIALSSLPARDTLRTLLGDFASLGLKLALALAVIALLDLLYTRREFARQMRMSRRELKDEIKHREGDPRIRARLRELRRELLKRAMGLQRTKTADVLVTNPTHVAVALKYVHGEMESPQLVAKGAGFVAAAMRRIASRHGVPIVQNPALARSLFRELQVDGHVPPAFYAQVARIIVWVFAAREAKMRRVPDAARSAA
jgi:flagellar biosynthetic protein FlhB